jgi:hypothetical protein
LSGFQKLWSAILLAYVQWIGYRSSHIYSKTENKFVRIANGSGIQMSGIEMFTVLIRYLMETLGLQTATNLHHSLLLMFKKSELFDILCNIFHLYVNILLQA